MEAKANSTTARQACRIQNCCSRGATGVTGADIVRISRTLVVEPWHFTQAAPAAADDPTGVIVDDGRRRVTLKLANAAQGCVFLLRTAGGAGCCGLGDLAPVSCRVFPADPTTGDAGTRHPSDCSCREWTDEQTEDLGRSLAGRAADEAHWHETVARWNRQFDASPGAAVGIEDFQRYLLEAHAAREAGTDWPEDVRA